MYLIDTNDENEFLECEKIKEYFGDEVHDRGYSVSNLAMVRSTNFLCEKF